MPELPLPGCAPVPLAHYLKAMGIFRLISDQADSAATARWQGDTFILNTRLDEDGLVAFFRDEYKPSPLINPWNGDGGFFTDSRTGSQKVLDKLKGSRNSRFIKYRELIQQVERVFIELSIHSKKEFDKNTLLKTLRSNLSDRFVGWMDSLSVATDRKIHYAPLLGGGGNDGSIDFCRNFILQLFEVIDPASDAIPPNSDLQLRSSLFAEIAIGTTGKMNIGQFYPGAAGGANATAGFDGPATVNPWDYILMLEGALLFAAASVKRLESGDNGALAYPFCVRQAGVGYASAAGADEVDARCEMWLPLWDQPVGLSELQTLFSEGRAQVHGRAASNGIDFAQAVVTLGVDRGICAFQRYGFQVRNGLAYFATPLERVAVRRNARADLLADFALWHERLRQKAGPRANPAPPASAARALRSLEQSMLALCADNTPARLLGVLAALGRTERAIANSFRWSKDSAYLKPLARLRPEWLRQANDGSREFRLAASLAGLRASLGKDALFFRQHLEPVRFNSRFAGWDWDDQPGNDIVWREGDLTGSLLAILQRRMLRVRQAGMPGWPDRTPLLSSAEYHPLAASLDDIAAFIDGEVDEPLLTDLLWALSALNWEQLWPGKPIECPLPAQREDTSPAEEETWPEEDINVNFAVLDTGASADQKREARVTPSCFYALLRCGMRFTKKREKAIPLNPAIIRRAAAGDGRAASALASRRLRASGFAPLVNELPLCGDLARRSTAALLFPLDYRDFYQLERSILKPKESLV